MALALTGCSGWALSSGSELEQEAQKVHTQIQVMSLVATAARTQAHPASNSLHVMLDDAENELEDNQSALASLPADEPGRTEILDLTRAAFATLGPLRTAIDDRDTAVLDRLRQELDSSPSPPSPPRSAASRW